MGVGGRITARLGALRLPTARYFTPSGRSIQEKGIEPDVDEGHKRPSLPGSSASDVRSGHFGRAPLPIFD
jgi:C-terminal processing protease CtpA/Prc